jgi:hypothetical protein
VVRGVYYRLAPTTNLRDLGAKDFLSAEKFTRNSSAYVFAIEFGNNSFRSNIRCTRVISSLRYELGNNSFRSNIRCTRVTRSLRHEIGNNSFRSNIRCTRVISSLRHEIGNNSFRSNIRCTRVIRTSARKHKSRYHLSQPLKPLSRFAMNEVCLPAKVHLRAPVQ